MSIPKVSSISFDKDKQLSLMTIILDFEGRAEVETEVINLVD